MYFEICFVYKRKCRDIIFFFFFFFWIGQREKTFHRNKSIQGVYKEAQRGEARGKCEEETQTNPKGRGRKT